MKSKDKTPLSGPRLQKLSLSIGNFIRYWGFRRIHGAIWAQLYLSKTPLSCTDLTKKLKLSKALISPALDELCKYKLIFEVPGPNEKIKIYRASNRINEVIQHVLRTREAKMLKQINQDFSSFKKDEAKSEQINQENLKSLEDMILNANVMLEVMLAQKDVLNLSKEFNQ